MQKKKTTISEFKKLINSFYKTHGRDLPWRRTKNTYKIFVSEIMLQQTQVDRVIPKYKAFIKTFPTPLSLAGAPQSSVIRAWQGLGYNRRALNLQKAAKQMVDLHDGALPTDPDDLLALPGVGPATVGSLLAFAHNIPHPFIETNIRRIYIHHFFPGQANISDEDLLPLIEQTLDRNNPRDWYSALMDYGSELPKEVTNPNRKSKHYTRQSKFEGSLRQTRGAILKLLGKTPATKARISKTLDHNTERITQALKALEQEGFITKKKSTYHLA